MNTPTRIDRQGKLYTNEQTIGVGGAVVENRVLFLDPFYFGELPPDTRTDMTAGRDAEVTNVVLKCRWFDGIKAGMIITAEDQTYRITGHRELERRQWLLVYARQVA